MFTPLEGFKMYPCKTPCGDIDCLESCLHNRKQNKAITESRQFLLDDITALMQNTTIPEWLRNVNDDGLYRLWQDLVNLTTMEATT